MDCREQRDVVDDHVRRGWQRRWFRSVQRRCEHGRLSYRHTLDCGSDGHRHAAVCDVFLHGEPDDGFDSIFRVDEFLRCGVREGRLRVDRRQQRRMGLDYVRHDGQRQWKRDLQRRGEYR